MVVDRSGIHRRTNSTATLATIGANFASISTGPLWPPPQPYRRLLAGDEDTIGAGRCFGALHQLYQRTRRVLNGASRAPHVAFRW